MKVFFKELLETVALALLIFLALQASVRNYRVELSSMETSLFQGDRVLVNKLTYFHLDLDKINRALPFVDIGGDVERWFPFHPPRRGDIVVFRFPKDPSRNFVKRVIGLSGDEVEIRRGHVFINGERLEEPYIEERDNDNLGLTLVPPDSYFVLGDNRDGSNDSRHWGPVPIDNIVGKTWFRYWPPSDFSFLSKGPLVLQQESPVDNLS